MSRVRNRDTGLERQLRSAVFRQGVRFRKHVAALPGRPDLVVSRARLAVFIDGDFWHGYRFPAWQHKLSVFWRRKIALNRHRDIRNFRTLRRAGWRVLRFWQHQIERDLDACVQTVVTASACLDEHSEAGLSSGAVSMRRGRRRRRSKQAIILLTQR
jgi:DNA mismatch endonuclease, patch repair protein